MTGNKAYQPGGAYHGKPLSCKQTQADESILYHWRIPDANSVVSAPTTPKKVFAGKDASRALGKTSTKPEDVSPEWRDLPEKEQNTLNDWITFFSKRYNVVGKVEGATNFE